MNKLFLDSNAIKYLFLLRRYFVTAPKEVLFSNNIKFFLDKTIRFNYSFSI